MSTSKIVVVSPSQEQVILEALKNRMQDIGNTYQPSHHSDLAVTATSDAAELFGSKISLSYQGDGYVVKEAKERRERGNDDVLADILRAYYPSTGDEEKPGLLIALHAINDATDFEFEKCKQSEVVVACCHAVGAYMFANFTQDDIDSGRSDGRYEECRKKIRAFVQSAGFAKLVLDRKAK